MPCLRGKVLIELLRATRDTPDVIHFAHDGERSQPVLELYPGDQLRRNSLAFAIQRGERLLQQWLAGQHCKSVRLAAESIQNVNHPDELEGLLHS